MQEKSLVDSPNYLIQIYNAENKPAEEVLRQSYAIFQESFPKELMLSYEKFSNFSVTNPSEKLYFAVAIKKGTNKVIGGSWVSYFGSTRNIYCWLYFVNPHTRGKGLGKKFFLEMINKLKEKHPDTKRVFIETEDVTRNNLLITKKRKEANIARARFWERLGFRRAKIDKGLKNPFSRAVYFDQRFLGLDGEKRKRTIPRFEVARSLVDVYHRYPQFTVTLPSGRTVLSSLGKKTVLKHLGRSKIYGKKPFRLVRDTIIHSKPKIK
ncbi:MAG: GNAT family N-acetyltransferase [archaeon]|jgi:GNAT superfamily N-acetyltransferase